MVMSLDGLIIYLVPFLHEVNSPAPVLPRRPKSSSDVLVGASKEPAPTRWCTSSFGYIYFAWGVQAHCTENDHYSETMNTEPGVTVDTHDVVLQGEHKWGRSTYWAAASYRPTIIWCVSFILHPQGMSSRCNKLAGSTASMCVLKMFLRVILVHTLFRGRTTAVYCHPVKQFYWNAATMEERNFLVCGHRISDTNTSRCSQDNRVASSEFVYFQC
jgi:hypothetical protein